jgi:signal transduction histidine kinase
MTELLSTEELSTLFLFEALEPEQLAWLSERGRVSTVPAGTPIYVEGRPAECFYVLLEGTAALLRRVQSEDVELSRSSQRGAYAGATTAFVGNRDEPAPAYTTTWAAITDCRIYALPAAEFGPQLRRWFPMAMHLLDGLSIGMRQSEAAIGQRERLLALGRLSAGLTHELNNPAAAAVRATSALRERVSRMRHKLAGLASGALDAAALMRLTAVQEEAVESVAKAPKLTPLQTSDAEDELADWLEDHGVEGGWEMAPTLVAAGLDLDYLERVTTEIPAKHLANGLRWITYTVETELLMNEISDATGRISQLVEAAKQYSQLDRAPHQDIDVHDGLDSTLVMFSRKLGPGTGVKVVKEYDRTLPKIPAYPAELNQVWTNLIENAVHAMDCQGRLTIRTQRDADRLRVDIGDTGPGVPQELTGRIFEPFFTTKAVGEGTGLGLDISWRIVVQRHGGDLRVDSKPGETWFRVLLPLTEPVAS